MYANLPPFSFRHSVKYVELHILQSSIRLYCDSMNLHSSTSTVSCKIFRNSHKNIGAIFHQPQIGFLKAPILNLSQTVYEYNYISNNSWEIGKPPSLWLVSKTMFIILINVKNDNKLRACTLTCSISENMLLKQ
jgi:hypothetical protein